MPKKNSLRKLMAQYQQILKRARDRQRNGDIRGYSALVEEAQQVARLIDELQQSV